MNTGKGAMHLLVLCVCNLLCLLGCEAVCGKQIFGQSGQNRQLHLGMIHVYAHVVYMDTLGMICVCVCVCTIMLYLLDSAPQRGTSVSLQNKLGSGITLGCD